ncbi:cell number regulator 10-like [Cynara cardunculus var. scolymus]|uniref:cell number regulator 10-like n=1 Tax=Cynara cardunculus var. scolymus TaxID=59895 RepID=UPI000D62C1BA|nr:cell number regulator 10-like [Cynara cardunculus var. scolymus]
MNINGHHPPQSKWVTGLFDCGGDPATCCITYCLPCVTFGQIAEMLDEGQSSCMGQGCVYCVLMMFTCHWLYACLFRERLRAKYGLPADPCNDCCVHFCCHACALCQEHAQLKHRGLDPSKGWIGPPNAPPQMPPTMER